MIAGVVVTAETSASAGTAVTAVAAASTGPRPSITLSKPFPPIIRQSDTLVVAGRAHHAKHPARALLEVERATWSTVATGRVDATGRFTITWQVPADENAGPVMLRISVRGRGRVLARTKAVQSAIGPAPLLCAPPAPPAVDIPVGDGWIVGGRYLAGGPFPGIYNCDSQDYTVTATDANGVDQATETVAGGQSYTLVVPAGTYSLQSDFCRGTATVTAGQQTQADTVCPVP
jgi:hypothetical protein